MAYSKWRQENSKKVEQQQIVEAVSAIREYTTKNDLTDKINPDLGKKCLQAMSRMKARRPSGNVTISEILHLKREISEIVVKDLFEDSPPKNEERESVMEDETEITNDGDKDESGDESYEESDEDNGDKFIKMLLSQNANPDKNPYGDLGQLTQGLMNTMVNPMINSIVNIAKPNIKNLLLLLEPLKEDRTLEESKRQLYSHAYDYYAELDELYKRNISAMDQAIVSEEIGQKYDTASIDKLLKKDPKIGPILTNMSNTNVADSLNQLENMGDQCTIS